MGKALELTQLPSFVVANSTTMTVNAFNFTVGSDFIANTTGAYHTGTVNAASHTVGSSFIANSTAVIVGNTSVGWFGFGETTPVSTRAFNIKRSWTTDSTAMTSFSNTIINNTTLTAPRGYYGQWNIITSNILDANSSGGIQGSDVYGTYTYALNGSVGGDARINNITGSGSEVRNQAGGATANTVDTATGSISKVIQSSSGITTQAVGVKSQIYAANNSVTGNVTSAYGFSSLIQSNTAMTVGTGYLYHGTYQGSTTTTRYGLYITGEANNYLSGNLSVAGSANVTTSVNSALLTVGSNFIANTTGAYHTGTVNAASYTVGSNFIANTTAVGIGTTSTLGNSLLSVLTGITARTEAASGVTPYFQSYNGNASTDLKTWRFGTVAAGDLIFETVNDAYSASTERMRIDSSANLKFNSGYGSVATAYGCRAWVNFNGTGVVAIRASGNVTSITDNGVGDYTVNFTNAMPDGNYAYHIGSKQDQAGVGDAAFPTNGTPTGVTDGAAGMTTTRIRLRFVNLDGTASLRDQEVVCVSIFR
jgi:hypothetical protein